MRHLAHRIRFHRARQLNKRWLIRHNINVPCDAVFAIDGQRTILIGRKLELIFGGILCRLGSGGCPGDSLGHGQRINLTVKAQGNLRTSRHRQRTGRHVIQIDGRLACIGRRFDPAFPDRSGRQCLRRNGGGHRAKPQERTKQQRDNKEKQGNKAQAIRVAV